jgi:CubicO group peptidase (beta-lactamase class C family)
MWIDPERQMFVILLTNRVHAARALRPAKVISDVRADLSDAAVLSVLDGPELASRSGKFRADREVGWNPPPRRASRRRHGSSRHHTIASATSKHRSSSAKKSSSSRKKSSSKKR